MKNCSVFVLFLFSLFGHSQNQPAPLVGSKNVEDALFKINALVPGASYELGLGKNTTVNFEVRLNVGARGGSGVDTKVGILPGAQIDFRYFTNFNRRRSKEKNISGNSGNYLAVGNQFLFGDAVIGNLDYSSSLNHIAWIAYGIQRTRPKGFYWGVSFGPGLYTDDFDSEFTLFADLRLGWVLKKKNRN